MSTPQIGVHLADHSFFPIFQDSSPGRRRVILTTSHTDQECVDIVLYRRDPEFTAGEERLGHVMLCDIASGAPDTSEIELTLCLGEDGRIDATALDRRTGNSRDVSIDRDEAMPEYEEQDDFAAGDVQDLFDDAKPSRRSNTPWLLVLLLVLLLAVTGLVIWRFVLPGVGTAGSPENSTTAAPEPMAAPEPTIAPEPTAETAPPEPAPEPEAVAPIEEAPAVVEEPQPPAPAPVDNAGDPTDYEIKWGDTLWDISSMFYGTPWRFPEIADENKIADPDRIFADDAIRIPRR